MREKNGPSLGDLRGSLRPLEDKEISLTPREKRGVAGQETQRELLDPTFKRELKLGDAKLPVGDLADILQGETGRSRAVRDKKQILKMLDEAIAEDEKKPTKIIEKDPNSLETILSAEQEQKNKWADIDRGWGEVAKQTSPVKVRREQKPANLNTVQAAPKLNQERQPIPMIRPMSPWWKRAAVAAGLLLGMGGGGDLANYQGQSRDNRPGVRETADEDSDQDGQNEPVYSHSSKTDKPQAAKFEYSDQEGMTLTRHSGEKVKTHQTIPVGHDKKLEEFLEQAEVAAEALVVAPPSKTKEENRSKRGWLSRLFG